MPNDFVSVVLPTYNDANNLRRAIESVFNQTHKNWELIIVDNNSQDNTEELVKAYNSCLIKYIKVNNNGVIAVSRNVGIQAARGGWVAFLDSDDFWSEDKLHFCLQHRDADFIYHGVRRYRLIENKQVEVVGLLKCRDVCSDTYSNLLNYGPSPQTSSVMLKKHCLKEVQGFDEHPGLSGGEDYDLWVRLARSGCRFSFLESVKSFYLVGGDHFTTPKRSLVLIEYLSRKYFTCFEDRPVWIHKSVIASNLKLGNYKVALCYIKKLLRKGLFFATFRVLVLFFQ